MISSQQHRRTGSIKRTRNGNWDRIGVSGKKGSAATAVTIARDLNSRRTVNQNKTVNPLADKIGKIKEEIKRIFSGETESSAHKFNRLSSQWESETGLMSNKTKAYLHPAYLAVIGMGKEAIPFLLRKIKAEEFSWLLALESITQISLAKEKNLFEVDEIVSAWLNWGEKNGFLPNDPQIHSESA